MVVARGVRAGLLAAAVLAVAGCGRSGPVQAFVEGDFGFPSPEGSGEAPPLPAFGDGHDGDYAADGNRVNDCTVLTSGAARSVQLQSASDFEVGDLVLVWQVQDVFAAPADTTTPVVAAASAGQWDIARVYAIDGDTLSVSPPVRSYVTSGFSRAQACRVPEFRDVSVPSGEDILAFDWNGLAGGIIAFKVDGTLTLDGRLDADSRGFRGGSESGDGDGVSNIGTNVCTTSAQGGGKGEGLDPTWFGQRCSGRVANGGGGGNGHNGGGGGGGNGGAGGTGGWEYNPGLPSGDDISRGKGGASAVIPGALVMGGGGGGGHQNDGGSSHRGGAGGGVILVWARTIVGTGVMDADGENGGPSSRVIDGAGGGGAGGTVHVHAENGTAFTGTISVRGGSGGLSQRQAGTNPHGPGGGGGAGVVRFGTSPAVGTVVSAGGAPGDNDGGIVWGAEGGGTGVIE